MPTRTQAARALAAWRRFRFITGESDHSATYKGGSMIVVRNTFQLKFGAAKEATALMKEGLEFLRAVGVKDNRICMDLTGPFYTLVLENTHESLGAFEQMLTQMGQDERWQKWYQKFSALIESGHREIYRVIL
jgi:hypothetical protein